jgi:hypothetical protein
VAIAVAGWDVDAFDAWRLPHPAATSSVANRKASFFTIPPQSEPTPGCPLAVAQNTRNGEIDKAQKLTELIVTHRKHNIRLIALDRFSSKAIYL